MMTTSRLAAIALLLSLAAPAYAQVSPSGASNAAAASPGGIPPTMPGTGAGSTNPGQINVAPEAPRSTPAMNPNQVPNTGPMLNSTRPPPARATVGAGRRAERGTVRSRAAQRSQRAMDKALDDSASKRIKDICRGC
jgi:hypothetical protein